jgi:hypothetical protein
MRPHSELVCHYIFLAPETESQKVGPGRGEKLDGLWRSILQSPATRNPSRTSLHSSLVYVLLSRSLQARRAKTRRPLHLAEKRLSWPSDLLPAPPGYLVDLGLLVSFSRVLPQSRQRIMVGFEPAGPRLPPRHGMCLTMPQCVPISRAVSRYLRNHASCEVRKSCTARKDSVRRRRAR